MKNLVSAIFIGLLPSLALAGGHSGLGGTGTGTVVDSKTMKGKSGALVQQTTKDVWLWDNPPEGFYKATSATCTQFLTFATGQEQPVGFNAVCQSVDPDGDVAVSLLTAHPDGALITQTSGTGKWAALNGIKFIGKTDIRIDAKNSTYSWKPAN